MDTKIFTYHTETIYEGMRFILALT